ncbi:helix-turn-helix domain-containing protein [Paenibacillus sp. PK3_47]|uniref:helix-turn-helix domain-containing protein n=1 Tax=Paenibacillus sp. PK3_47 TaxID=2072642 RepID=UPI00201D5500|nr:helix-turn-helix domain-containing protein [Paenibacillus sp. PK3_47]
MDNLLGQSAHFYMGIILSFIVFIMTLDFTDHYHILRNNKKRWFVLSAVTVSLGLQTVFTIQLLGFAGAPSYMNIFRMTAVAALTFILFYTGIWLLYKRNYNHPVYKQLVILSFTLGFLAVNFGSFYSLEFRGTLEVNRIMMACIAAGVYFGALSVVRLIHKYSLHPKTSGIRVAAALIASLGLVVLRIVSMLTVKPVIVADGSAEPSQLEIPLLHMALFMVELITIILFANFLLKQRGFYKERLRSIMYQSLMDDETEAMLVLSSSGEIIKADERIGLMLGYPDEQLVNRMLAELVSPQDLLTLIEFMRNVRTGQMQKEKLRFISRQGDEITAELYGMSVMFNDKVISVNCMLKPVSETFPSYDFVEEVPFPMFVVEANTQQIIYTNLQFQTLFPPDGVKQYAPEIIDPGCQQLLDGGITLALEGNVSHHQLTVKDRQLGHVPVIATFSPGYTTEEGTVVNVHILLQLVNDMIQTAPSHSSERLLMDSATNAMALLAFDDTGETEASFTYINQAMRRLLSIDDMGCDFVWRAIFSPETGEKIAGQIAELTLTGNPSFTLSGVRLTAPGMKEVTITGTAYGAESRTVLLTLKEESAKGRRSGNPDPGRNLRIIMAELDINTSELAARSGLSLATISNLRTGKIIKPQYTTAASISRALSVEIEDLWETIAE